MSIGPVTYGGTTVTSQIPSITDVIPTPQGMYTDKTIEHLFSVEHCVICKPGAYAVPLASGWLRSGEPHSINGIIDCVASVQLLMFGLWTWGCGGDGNPYSDQWEQAGDVTMSRLQWMGRAAIGSTYVESSTGQTVVWTQLMNDQMAAQFVRFATMRAEVAKFYAGPAPFYLSQAQYLDAITNGTKYPSGWVPHYKITLWGPNHLTTHTDHAPNFPEDESMALSVQIYNGGTKPPVVPPSVSDWKFVMSLSGAPSTYAQYLKDQQNENTLLLAQAVADKVNADGTPTDPKKRSFTHGIGVAANRVQHNRNYDNTAVGK